MFFGGTADKTTAKTHEKALQRMEGLGRGAEGRARPVCASCASSLVIPPIVLDTEGAGAVHQPRGVTGPLPVHVTTQADRVKRPASPVAPGWGANTHMQSTRGV